MKRSIVIISCVAALLGAMAPASVLAAKNGKRRPESKQAKAELKAFRAEVKAAKANGKISPEERARLKAERKRLKGELGARKKGRK